MKSFVIKIVINIITRNSCSVYNKKRWFPRVFQQNNLRGDTKSFRSLHLSRLCFFLLSNIIILYLWIISNYIFPFFLSLSVTIQTITVVKILIININYYLLFNMKYITPWNEVGIIDKKLNHSRRFENIVEVINGWWQL